MHVPRNAFEDEDDEDAEGDACAIAGLALLQAVVLEVPCSSLNPSDYACSFL